MTRTTPILGVICHKVWYSLPVCKIWRF